jgi:malate dehydrogenase (oxaloacetate-decarboxylating)(NADP+)
VWGKLSPMTDEFRERALYYHRHPVPGKLQIQPTKRMVNQLDLALAYSPGVAVACEEIVQDPSAAAAYTTRGNLVGVVTNGTAVLGLGPIGPLASKPVMEGKAVLFKKFAGVDVFDIEINETDPDKFVDIVASLEPTFGGINLEDIKAPECFDIERKLRERMSIPVMHDDQHGTAICVAAAVRNGLRLIGKRIEDVRLVGTGAGAAALACVDLLVAMGLRKENVTLCDIHGVVHVGRDNMDPYKERYAIDGDARVLDDVIDGADVFLGLSAPRVLAPEQVRRMADRPLIMALANPEPEIRPELVREVRPDAIIGTGRSDYPNQINNVLVFPYIFRGALDVGATDINKAMKLACVEALADLVMEEADEEVAAAYGGGHLRFGPDYLIPKPFDPRLISEVPLRVAKAAMDSGVATRPIDDLDAYRHRLETYVFRSGLVMKPVFERASRDPRRLVYAEGESMRVLRAIQVLLDDGIIARPLLLGRRDVIDTMIREMGLHIVCDEHFDVLDPSDNPNYERDCQDYHRLMERKNVSPAYARAVILTRTTALATVMLRRGDVDGMICGVNGGFHKHLNYVHNVIGPAPGVADFSAVNLLITPKGSTFITDTYVTYAPTAERIAETTRMAADVVRRFGLTPRAALLSHSNFGSSNAPSAQKMRDALQILFEREPDLEVEGEMHSDAAISEQIRERIFPNSRLKGSANLLIMPDLDAANIAFNLLKALGDAVNVGPILAGVGKPAHVLTQSVTVRGIVNMSAIAVVDAQEYSSQGQ